MGEYADFKKKLARYCFLGIIAYLCNPNMVSIVQLVEHQIVVLGVVGSSPTGYPTGKPDEVRFTRLFYFLVECQRLILPLML